MGIDIDRYSHDNLSEDTLVCSDPDCEGRLEVHYITESDTGLSYYTSGCEDAASDPCPICGKEWKD